LNYPPQPPTPKNTRLLGNGRPHDKKEFHACIRG